MWSLLVAGGYLKVLGLMVDLQRHYVVTSNRESGFGRYDVMHEPREKG